MTCEVQYSAAQVRFLMAILLLLFIFFDFNHIYKLNDFDALSIIGMHPFI